MFFYQQRFQVAAVRIFWCAVFLAMTAVCLRVRHCENFPACFSPVALRGGRWFRWTHDFGENFVWVAGQWVVTDDGGRYLKTFGSSESILKT